MQRCNIGIINNLQKNVEQEIINKTNELRASYKDVKKVTLENNFFQSVLDDYEKYYNHIIKEKQQQYDALKLISNHLDKLLLESSFSEYEIKNLRMDQKDILGRLDSIKNELDEIVDEDENSISTIYT
jgi:hypothetical protein